MAPPPGTLRVGRYFLALFALLVLLYLLVFLPGERHTPKLGLDLVGGQQVIFQARTPNGQTPSSSSMEQAKQIIEDRVNGTGVTEATVVIQGDDQLVVSIPGGTGKDVRNLGAAAVLNFRGVVAPAAPVGCGANAATTTPSGSASASVSPSASASASTPAGSTGSAKASPNGAGERPLTAPSGTSAAKSSAATSSAAKSSAANSSAANSSATTSGAATTAPASTAAAAPTKCALTSVAQLKKAVKLPAASAVYKTNGLSSSLYQQVQAALSNYDCSRSQTAPDPKNDYYIACQDNQVAYLLGPVVVAGSQIDTANAVAPNVGGAGGGGTTEWTVSLQLKGAGEDNWSAYTGAHNIGGSSSTAGNVTQCGTTTPCANYVAFTLDGNVISAPVNESAINGQATQITGGFTQTTANDLADQLKYGALPLSFKSQQAQSVSATLGTSQLKAGLLAGGIGLALVVLYSLLYYRALGLVTIASLLVSGGLTYSMLVVLGKQIGFTLSLAGIAGFIVAVGITADSFVVFFERIKDEVHEGRSVRVAVPRAWVRARRTILSADTVSFLAAAILYYFAAGDVKGFAFTLGLSTLLDVIIVFWFTHPLVSLLSRSRAFGSARFTGLNSVRAGGIAPPSDADELPVRRGRPAAKRARGATAVLDKPKASARRSKVVLDDDLVDEDVDTDVPGDETAAEPTARGATAEPDHPDAAGDAAAGDAAAADDEAADDQAAETPRRRTTPAAGTAAERAAARRARLREQRDTDGKGDR